MVQKVKTKQDVDDIYIAKNKITLYEAELWGAIQRRDVTRVAYFKSEITRLKTTIRQQYDIIL